MTPRRAAALLIVLLTLASWSAFGAQAEVVEAEPAEPAVSEVAPVRGDLDRVDEILDEEGVRRSTAPSWVNYPAHLIVSWIRSWADAVFGSTESLDLFVAALIFFARLVIWVAIAGIVLWLLRFLFLAFRGRRPAAVSDEDDPDPALSAAAIAGTDWRREIDARLARDDVGGALEAAWWWLAGRVAGERLDPSWTSRQLMARVENRSRRRSLSRLVARLDAMIYGPVAATPESLVQLVRKLEGVLT